MDFNFQDRPTIFEDLETGEELRLHPAEVHGRTKRGWRNSAKTWTFGAQYAIDWVDVDIASGVFPVLSAYLVTCQDARCQGIGQT